MRFFACLLTLALVSTALPASAQESVRPKDPKEQAQPPRTRPRASTLDELFERLGKAQSEREAEGISSLIERRFSRSGSDTADLLLNRAAEAYGKKDFPLAIELIDRVLVLQPNWAEAWYKRATVFYQLDDPVGAMADLHRAIKIEPRHFNAWTGLGHILMASDDKVHALEAYRRVLKINPQMSDVKTIVNRLAPEVDGQDL
ncbi:tetratricopeptide repeat protein [Microvirga lotononidis]|uniref:Tetratricopeptide repeat protein n=1 Tax=Microvirga lotononidis TaxID=864069 RepID=I4YTN8_9HYPH|nr:tetratricopeptide repeat protein [Microvirga lotononidis]EIM27330.1 tetratricopeptide repeat protein [Microvirga lotononidis]WQO28499.1 tetratricopeptide repeat protein [Microvirga lotononidis]